MSNFGRKARRRRLIADRPYCHCGKAMIHRSLNTGRGRRRYWICRCGNVRPIGKKPADAAELEESKDV